MTLLPPDGPTYVLITNSDGSHWLRCLRCGYIITNEADVLDKFCTHCLIWLNGTPEDPVYRWAASDRRLVWSAVVALVAIIACLWVALLLLG